MPNQPVRFHYGLALDESFTRVLQRDSAVATPELGHSVHPEITGLEPHPPYWYRFRVGREIGLVGRIRTMPRPNTDPGKLTFVFASCRAWQDGYSTAYDHLAEEDLDLVVHLGD